MYAEWPVSWKYLTCECWDEYFLYKCRMLFETQTSSHKTCFKPLEFTANLVSDCSMNNSKICDTFNLLFFTKAHFYKLRSFILLKHFEVHTPSGLFKKYRKFWICASYVYSIFDFFVALCWYSYPSFTPTISFILNIQLIFDSDFAWTCFGSDRKSVV